MDRIIEWLEAHQLPCYYKKILGVECLGCGMQTSFIFLLKGDLYNSFITFPALFPQIFLFVFLILHLTFRFKKGAVILKISFIFTLAVMVVSYVVRILTP